MRRPLPRVARVASLLLALGLVIGRTAPAPAAPRAGYDHQLHERDLLVATGAQVPCARCHDSRRGTLPGRPDHAACFGDCHGPRPTRIEAERWRAEAAAPEEPAAPPVADPASAPARARTCGACHAAEELRRRAIGVSYPPYQRDRDWGVALSHRKHRAAACPSCHAPTAAGRRAPPAPHQRCAGCHTGAGEAFAMDRCAGCHFPAVGGGAAPRLRRSAITVTAAFSHERHQRRVRRPATAADACLPCHRQIHDESAPGDVLAPTAATCAGTACHDGEAAFAVTERCSSCHRAAPRGLVAVARPTSRFLHAQHADALAAGGCATCHPLDDDAAATPRAAGHAACATCHAEDFGAPQPRTCGACHTSTEPWRRLRADQLPAQATEFGAQLDHRRHPQPCARCHAQDTPTRELRPPRDHAACSSAGCHRARGGPAPELKQCQGCHRAALVATRDAQRRAAPWSVRGRFRHATHREGLDGRALACAACHGSLDGPVETLATPPKRTCEPCHDGARAFSVTGVQCARCHGGGP
ncbi:MAG: cytochrome c3 family protein [Kofleriaceae bacterium]